MADQLSMLSTTFEGLPVRVVDVDGEPHFVGKDVAEVLGYQRPNDALQQHCKGAVKRRTLPTSGGPQELRVISEPDLLRLVMGSRLPAAERFERWVFEDVLPTIRRTGSYGFQVPQTLTGALKLAAELSEARDAAENLAKQLELQVKEQAPKVAALAAIAGTDGSKCFREAASVLQVRPKDLKNLLLAEHWLYYRGSTLFGYGDKLQAGLLEHKGVRIERSDAADLITQVRITPKGITRIGELLQRQRSAA